jgi:hypothetical protein
MSEIKSKQEARLELEKRLRCIDMWDRNISESYNSHLTLTIGLIGFFFGILEIIINIYNLTKLQWILILLVLCVFITSFIQYERKHREHIEEGYARLFEHGREADKLHERIKQ